MPFAFLLYSHLHTFLKSACLLSFFLSGSLAAVCLLVLLPSYLLLSQFLLDCFLPSLILSFLAISLFAFLFPCYPHHHELLAYFLPCICLLSCIMHSCFVVSLVASTIIISVFTYYLFILCILEIQLLACFHTSKLLALLFP